MVFGPATTDEKLPLVWPAPLVGAEGCTSVLPPPVALSVTLRPGIGPPAASRTVTVSTELPAPAVSVVGVAVRLEREALGCEGLRVMLPDVAVSRPGDAKKSV